MSSFRTFTLVATLAAAAVGLLGHGPVFADEAQVELGIQPQALDPHALTDDHSTNVPTESWTYTAVTDAQISDLLDDNQARLTEIELHSIVGGVQRFSVRMVKNAGAYAVPGWWWYFGITAQQLITFVNDNNARLIDIEPYDVGGGQIRFAAVMISNTGGAGRGWTYLMGVSSAQIVDHINNTHHRMIDIDSYFEGGVKKYTAVFVVNTGADEKRWEWWINQSPASIASRVSAFKGRIVKLERQADGNYNFIQVDNTGKNASAWWYGYGFASITDLSNFGNQFASRPIDITTYVDGGGIRRYDGVFIDNANDSTRRMRKLLGETFLDANGAPTKGIFESYLKQVDGEVKVDLNSTRRAETASALKALHLLHSMRQIQLGLDTLPSAFTYYQYDALAGSNACPDPSKETLANRRTDLNFEQGLDAMMNISDNRTTRGTVLRYGGSFTPFNTTAAASGLTGTTLRHDIGCAYWNFSTGKLDPANRRNDTTAADLARIYEGVWNKTLLNDSARAEFLESANPSSGVSSALQTVISEEAAKQGKSSIATQFGTLVRTWGKAGSYGTCLPDINGNCAQLVMIRSGAGLIRLPVKKANGKQVYRDYVFGRLISDTPIGCWDCPEVAVYESAYGKAANELYRDEIRKALKTW